MILVVSKYKVILGNAQCRDNKIHSILHHNTVSAWRGRAQLLLWSKSFSD